MTEGHTERLEAALETDCDPNTEFPTKEEGRMPTLRIEYGVPNFDEWKRLFDSDPADRKGSGVLSYDIFRSVEDPDYVLIDVHFATVDEAMAFHERVREIWSGSASEVVQNPRARLVEEVETRRL